MTQPHVLILFRHRYNLALHRAVAAHAGRAGWHLSVLQHTEDKPLRGLTSLHGILIGDSMTTRVLRSLELSGLPTVNLTAHPRLFRGHRVTADSEAIGQLAADYLLNRKHRHFIYYGDPAFGGSVLRERAFLKYLRERGHPCTLIHASDQGRNAVMDWEGESRRIQTSLAAIPTPAAAFCFNDILAGRLVDAALGMGRQVPEELSILGVDDDPLVCETAAVALSSVRHPLEEVGRRGAKLLDELMKRPKRASVCLLLPPGGITERRSTEFFAVEHPALQGALLYLDKNHSQAVSLDDAARASGVSTRSLQLMLRTHLNSTLTEELAKRRLSHARRLLEQPTPSVSEVATLAGFASPAHFHQLFKKTMGETPRRYRESRLESRSIPFPT